MTLSTLLVAAVALLVYIGLYWGALFIACLAGALQRQEREASDATDRGDVAVLVPVHNEGAAVVDTVQTLFAQDYNGQVEVFILLQGLDDSAFEPLQAEFGAGDVSADGTRRLRVAEHRQLVVVPTGVISKHAKLNLGLQHTEAPYVALLDADHRATPGWISAAIKRLHADPGVVGVQARKAALSTNKLTQVWDGCLSHLGHECLNRGLSGNGLDVFFTGSTAVFRADVARRHGFTDTLTEDTYLTFDILAAGDRIAYGPGVGSYEEMAPNLQSFAARRRRWSAGHTFAFFRHVRGVLSAEIPRARKAQLLVIGQFFLLPALIMAFFYVQAAYYFLQFTPKVQALTFAAATLPALALTLIVSRGRRTKINDFVVCLLWFLPHVAMSGALFYLLFDEELYYFILEFPYQGTLWGVQATFIVGAVLIMFFAWFRLRAVSFSDLLAYVLTIPLVLFLEVLTALLGLSDHLAGRSVWSKIDRANVVSPTAVPESVRGRLRVGRQYAVRWRRFWWAPLVLGSLFVANEIGSVDDCGAVDPWLWPPLFADASDEVRVEISSGKRLADDGQLALALTLGVTPRSGSPSRVRAELDGRPLLDERLRRGQRRTYRVERTLPLGWGRKRLEVVVSGAGIQCRRRRTITTNLVQTAGRTLRVNGEPFLIKGVIPTFSNARTNLTLDRGFEQLKSTGANVARFYHSPGSALLRAASETQMVLVLQPELSTWENVDLMSSGQQRRFLRRFKRLADTTNGFPFALFNNIGNEFEIRDRSARMLTAISSTARRAAALGGRLPNTYSTFVTYVNYPVPILGINMLDSGSTYWSKALDLVDRFGKPYYASEFGGFVAFFERTPAELRVTRIRQQWRELMRRRALGAVFFSSHDNWAQAVPPGTYNDPFRAEMPDDRRGFWDDRNRPKLELAVLAEVFSDLQATVIDRTLDATASRVNVRLTNRRPYRLVGVVVSVGDRRLRAVGDLAPAQTTNISLPLRALRARASYPWVRLDLAYTTHAGLAARSRIALTIPEPRGGPVVLNRGFVNDAGRWRTARSLRGRLLDGARLELVVPRGWRRVSVFDRVFPCDERRLSIPLTTPYHPVRALSMQEAGQWRAVSQPLKRRGRQQIRFSLPGVVARQRLLILSGVGAWSLRWRAGAGPWRAHPAHPYRETLIDLNRLGVSKGELSIEMDRQNIEYLEGRFAAGRSITIELDPPRIFAPVEVIVQRVD